MEEDTEDTEPNQPEGAEDMNCHLSILEDDIEEQFYRSPTLNKQQFLLTLYLVA